MALAWVSDKTAQTILDALHYAYPIILLFFFLFVFTLRSILTSKSAQIATQPAATQIGPGGKPLPRKTHTPEYNTAASLDFSRPRKLLFDWVALTITVTFVANATEEIMHALIKRDENYWCGKAFVIYVVGAFFVYSLLVISMIDNKPSPTSAHLSTWVVGLVMELILLGALIARDSKPHRDPNAKDPHGGTMRKHMSRWEIAEVVIDLIRIVLLMMLIVLYVLFHYVRNARVREAKAAAAQQSPGESTGLLSDHGNENGSAHVPANGYGSAAAGSQQKHADGAPPGWERPTTTPSRNWWEYLKGYTVLFPFLWPSKDRRLKVVVVVCFLLSATQCIMTFAVPVAVGYITDLLAEAENGPILMPWIPILLYIFFRFLQGNNGLLGALRAYLWIPVSQYSYRELSVAAFEHVHGLSLEFHLGKKTGEVLSALGKGSSINTFLEQVTFQVVPMLVNLVIAIVYFLFAFDAYYALTIAVVAFWYIYLTIRLAQWRAEIRRQMVNADREEDAVKNDSMVSYETVKYFNAETYEFNRYRDAVKKYQYAEYKVLFSLNLMNVCQNMVFMLGLLVTCFISAYQITIGQSTVGKFMTLITYMAQLQAPLNFFGTFYRTIQSAMINSERMLELFKEQPTVVDSPSAGTLPSCEGGITFSGVNFAYDSRKNALNGLDFFCKPGTTTALVGESGGGKSTVFRLLFRFYNVQSGSIQVDGHDVQDVTIDSLRRQMGVVPQDTVLFNESLMYNLKYANQEATDEDVYNACRAASIHDRILTFPDGYETKVGERGLRLSGGEKQRVAIARTILKNPRIILLDEATAALDTETEQHIQDALTTLGRGRTMLVIAHRLSTITLADQIIVLHDGRVDERGSHDELLSRKGRYASMWRKQVRAQKAAEEARVLKDRAERLRAEIGDGGEGSASQSEDERDVGAKRSQQMRGAGHNATNSSVDLRFDDHHGGKPHGHP